MLLGICKYVVLVVVELYVGYDMHVTNLKM
jgi:hypothetical protein